MCVIKLKAKLKCNGDIILFRNISGLILPFTSTVVGCVYLKNVAITY